MFGDFFALVNHVNLSALLYLFPGRIIKIIIITIIGFLIQQRSVCFNDSSNRISVPVEITVVAIILGATADMAAPTTGAALVARLIKLAIPPRIRLINPPLKILLFFLCVFKIDLTFYL